MGRAKVIAEHRAEGEPRTMARVEGMCAERWPHESFNVWIESREPRRHVAVRFYRGSGFTQIEGAGSTWFAAFDAVDAERLRLRIGAR